MTTHPMILWRIPVGVVAVFALAILAAATDAKVQPRDDFSIAKPCRAEMNRTLSGLACMKRA